MPNPIKILLPVLLLWCGILHAQQQKILLPVKQDGKWGYIDTSGKIVIAPKYDFAGDFEGSRFAKVQLNGKVFAIERDGKERDIKIPLAKQEVLKGFIFFVDSFILHKHPETGFWGMFNLDFETVLPYEYDTIYGIYNNNYWWTWRQSGAQIAIKKQGLYGIAEVNGTITIQPVYKSILRNFGQNYQVRSGDSTGLVNSKGQQMLPPVFNTLLPYNGGYYTASKYVMAMHNTQQWAIYDTLGTLVLEHGYTGIRPLNNDFALVNKGDSAWLFSFTTKKLVYVDGFTAFGGRIGQGLLVKTRNGSGILSDSGHFILPPQYGYVFLSNNYWLVSRNSLWGLCAQNGKVIIEPQYTYLDEVQGNVALVRQDSAWGMVNTSGELIIPVKYNDIDLYNNTAKARAGKTVDVYELTDNGTVDDVVNYSKVLTINVSTRNDELMRRSRDTRQAIQRSNWVRNVDSIGFGTTKGWFRDTATLKWGFKSANGDVLIPATYDKVTTSDSSTFAIVEIDRVVKVGMFGVEVEFSSVKGIVNQITGKIIAKPVFVYIDEEILRPLYYDGFDLWGMNYALALYLDGTFSVINKQGKILKNTGIRYADARYNGITRIFTGRTVNSTECKSQDESTRCIGLKNYINRLGGTIVTEMPNKTCYIYFTDGSWDYINAKGFPMKLNLKWAGSYTSNRAIVQTKNGFFGLLDNRFAYILSPEYSKITWLPGSNQQQLQVTTKKYLEGYMNTNGQMLTGVVFSATRDYNDGVAWVIEEHTNNLIAPDRYSLIDTLGFRIKNIAFERVKDFKEGYAAVCNGTRWGFIDTRGDTVCALLYRRVGDFSEGLAWVNRNGKIGYIDESGLLAIDCKYKKGGDFSGGLAAVLADGSYGYINARGTMVIKPQLEKAGKFTAQGYAICGVKKRFGIMDKDGKWVLPAKYKDIQWIQGSHYIASKGKRRILFDAASAQLKKLERYSEIKVNKAGFVEAKKGSRKTALVHPNGNLLANGLIKDFQSADETIVIAGERKKKGVLNPEGDTIISFEHNKLEQLGEGYIKVMQKQGNGWALYDNSGNTVGCCFNNISMFKDGFAPAQNTDGRWGLINTLGTWVVQPHYSIVQPLANGYTRIGLDEVNMISDLNGKFITNGSFESLQYIPEAKLYRIEQRNRIGYYSAVTGWVWQLGQ